MPEDQAEMASEQAYVDWAYERLDEMLTKTDRLAGAAGDIATHRALIQQAETRRATLLRDLDKLIIGRLDFTARRAKAVGQPTVYVGKTPIDGDDLDHQAVVDWRDDLGELFYQATRSRPKGVELRRTIVVQDRRVVRLSDDDFAQRIKAPKAAPLVQPPPIDVVVERPVGRELLEEVDESVTTVSEPARADVAAGSPARQPSVSPGELAPPTAAAADDDPDDSDGFDETGTEVRAKDLLLEELARERTSEMSEVVATIQADQDRWIRAEINTPLVIQGGPGTGKTIVGLHRAAYLLYQLRRQGQESSVLVIGPNPAFMEYIGSVLPSLGESTATQLSLEDLPLAHLTAKEKPLVRTRATVAPAVAQLLGDLRMAAAVEGAIRKSVKAEALRLGFGRYVLRLDVAKVSEVLEHLVGRSESYLEARRGLTNGLAEAFFEQYILRGPPGASGDQQLELIAASTRQLLSEGDLGKRLMPPLEARRLVIGLLDDLELLQEAGFDSAEAGLLHQRSRTRAYPWALEHLPLLDEAARHVRGVPTRFAHVVVDEAQDLSPMQWRMVSRRVKRRSITILGDLAQGMSVWSPASWNEVVEQLSGGDDATIGELRLGYRVTRQVMGFAANLGKVAAPSLSSPVSPRSGAEPNLKRVTEKELVSVSADAAVNSQEGSVAIVAPDGLLESLRAELAKTESSRVSVLTAEEARGREFDRVVVVEPAMIAAGAVRPAQTLYVAFTRPTKTLTVVHTADLPSIMDAGAEQTEPNMVPEPKSHGEAESASLAGRSSTAGVSRTVPPPATEPLSESESESESESVRYSEPDLESDMAPGAAAMAKAAANVGARSWVIPGEQERSPSLPAQRESHTSRPRLSGDPRGDDDDFGDYLSGEEFEKSEPEAHTLIEPLAEAIDLPPAVVAGRPGVFRRAARALRRRR